MITTNKPLLTIAIPNYNGGIYLKQTILSCKNILDLTNDEFEILVIDDLSKDNSIESIQELKKDFPNLRVVINEKNMGRIGNWNRCIELAEGKFLLIEMVGDTIYPISLKEDLLEMNRDNIFIRYSSSQEIAGFISYPLDKVQNIDINLSFPFFSCRDDIYATYLGASILNVDIIRNNNIIFDDGYTLVSDRKFLYSYFKYVFGGKLVSKKLLNFNTTRSDRATYSKMRFLFYDVIKLFNYYQKEENKHYNKNKAIFVLMSEMIATYFISKIRNKPTDLTLKELNQMRSFVDMSFIYFVFVFAFTPLTRLFFQLNARFLNFRLSLFTISNKGKK